MLSAAAQYRARDRIDLGRSFQLDVALHRTAHRVGRSRPEGRESREVEVGALRCGHRLDLTLHPQICRIVPDRA